jgi:hypothetical protein
MGEADAVQAGTPGWLYVGCSVTEHLVELSVSTKVSKIQKQFQ